MIPRVPRAAEAQPIFYISLCMPDFNMQWL